MADSFVEYCENIKQRITEFEVSKVHDKYVIETISEAILAAEEGSFGVGAILVDTSKQEIILKGHNKDFTKSRSDLHAEMDLITKFEKINKDTSRSKIKDLTLFTSLESCPMCLCRIITSGISKVYHIADDKEGGMVHLYNNLPPIWKEISKNRKFEKAICSKELSEISWNIFEKTKYLNKKII